MWQAPPFPCGSRPAWLPPSAGQFRTGRSPACLQRMDDGRNHRHIRASADPDSDALGFDLDAPDIRLGLASRCLALMANSHGRYQGVYHRRYKRWIVSHRRRQPACLPAPGEHLLWGQPVSPGDLGNDRARYQRLLHDPGLVVLGEPTTASCLRDHFQPARPHVDLSVWSSIDTTRSLQRDRETRLSNVPREDGSRTTLTFKRPIRQDILQPSRWNTAASRQRYHRLAGRKAE
jgi:hypothetical protein